MQQAGKIYSIHFFILSLLLLFTSNVLVSQDISPEYKIKSIFFGGGSYYIDYEQRDEIIQFFEGELLENYEIHIHSHTDNIGSVEFNERLSRMRSRSTVYFLIDNGIPEEKIFIKDHGLFNPEFDNDSWEGRQKNRRVDIVLWPLPA